MEKNLSWSGRLNRSAMLAKRLLQMPAAAAPTASTAQFQGNGTVITGPPRAMRSDRSVRVITRYRSITGIYTLSFLTPNDPSRWNDAELRQNAARLGRACHHPLTGTIDSTLSTYVQSIQVALGKGDGTFSAPTTVSGPDIMAASVGYYGSVVVADMNGDGIPDIVALGPIRFL